MGMYNNAPTMYPTPSPAPTAYPTPVPTGGMYGAQGSFTSPPHIYGQQTVNSAQRSMSGYLQAGKGRGEEKGSPGGALGWILGGGAGGVAGAGGGRYFFSKNKKPTRAPQLYFPRDPRRPNISGG